MTEQEIDNIKRSIAGLKLDENYYDDLRHNSEQLYKKMMMQYDYTFYDEDGNFVDRYNPDAYNVNIYLIHYNNKMYIGNEQIPTDTDKNNKQRTYNLIEYWFRGNNSSYVSLHEFIGVHNKSINYKGGGCNQGLLNVIKQKIIETINTNLNVNDIGNISSDEIQNQYGRLISKYKAKTRKLLKDTDIDKFSGTIVTVLNDIEKNIIPWLNMLYEKNRFWFISEYEQDKSEVNEFFEKYTSGRDELYEAVLIIFKEYLLWQTCEYYMNKGNYYKTIFSKKNYILNPKCSKQDLFDWRKMWDNHKPVTIILSICYKTIYENKKLKDLHDYKVFRNKLYKNISIKNNDR